ncbi:Ran-binding protein 9 [Chytriomyces hyalinus]|nr:Ran-binding protein 9 [Chytriomyces hyalinus]
MEYSSTWTSSSDEDEDGMNAASDGSDAEEPEEADEQSSEDDTRGADYADYEYQHSHSERTFSDTASSLPSYTHALLLCGRSCVRGQDSERVYSNSNAKGVNGVNGNSANMCAFSQSHSRSGTGNSIDDSLNSQTQTQTQPQYLFPLMAASKQAAPLAPHALSALVRQAMPSHFLLKEPPIQLRTLRNNHQFLLLDQSATRARYTGPGAFDKDAASVRCNKPCPSPRILPIFYFEVNVISKGRDGWMGMGLSARDVDLDRLPGWDPRSYGYHGDDGFIFECTGKGRTFGPTYTSGDVVGCLVNYFENTISFTKNGLMIGLYICASFYPKAFGKLARAYAFVNTGVAFRNISPSVPLHPTVGFRTPEECMEINFGFETPFKFDIDSYVLEAQQKIWREIQCVPLRPISKPRSEPSIAEPATTNESNLKNAVFEAANAKLRAERLSSTPDLLLHKLIAQHLEHAGYHETSATLKRTVLKYDVEDGIEIGSHANGNLKRGSDSKAGDSNLMEIDQENDVQISESLSIRKQSDPELQDSYIISLGRTLTDTFTSPNIDSSFQLSAQNALTELFSLVAYPKSALLDAWTAWKSCGSTDRRMSKASTASSSDAGVSVSSTVPISVRTPKSQKKRSDVFTDTNKNAKMKSATIQQQQQRVRGVDDEKAAAGDALKNSRSVGNLKVSVPLEVVQLMDTGARDLLAGALDRYILGEMGQETESVLEKLVQQTVVVAGECGEAGPCAVVGGSGQEALLGSLWRDCL